MSTIEPQQVLGDMTVDPNLKTQANFGEPDFSTLDEPIKDTIVRISFINFLL